jgi:hypothetical protein
VLQLQQEWEKRVSINQRAKQVVAELFALYNPHDEGGMAVDVSAVQQIVRRDPEAVTFAAQKILSSDMAGDGGWGIWIVVANVFEAEFDDDSLGVLLESAAAKAGVTLPGWRPISPPGEPKSQLIVLEMAEADVAAGDAHRMVMVLRLEGLAPETRNKMFGNCLVTFPAHGDERPVQHIPRIRTFVSDLHRRVPHFALFLNFDPKHCMHLVYYGCLAAPEATQVRPIGEVMFDVYHPTVLQAIGESLQGMRHACEPRGIAWKPHAERIAAPFDDATRRQILRAL